jgi:hypothetical protein
MTEQETDAYEQLTATEAAEQTLDASAYTALDVALDLIIDAASLGHTAVTMQAPQDGEVRQQLAALLKERGFYCNILGGTPNIYISWGVDVRALRRSRRESFDPCLDETDTSH